MGALSEVSGAPGVLVESMNKPNGGTDLHWGNGK